MDASGVNAMYLLRGTLVYRTNEFPIFHVIMGLNYAYIFPGVGTCTGCSCHAAERSNRLPVDNYGAAHTMLELYRLSHRGCHLPELSHDLRGSRTSDCQEGCTTPHQNTPPINEIVIFLIIWNCPVKSQISNNKYNLQASRRVRTFN